MQSKEQLAHQHGKEMEAILWKDGYTTNIYAEVDRCVKSFEAGYTACAAATTDKVTRLEVIDEKGRAYGNWNKANKVELSYQDDGRTLKIFITTLKQQP
jgi:hypothetical protein